MFLVMKIEGVHIVEMGFWNVSRQIEAYTLADYFSFDNKINIWL